VSTSAAKVIPFPLLESLAHGGGGGGANSISLAFLLAASLLGEHDPVVAANWPHVLRTLMRECPEVGESIERVHRDPESAAALQGIRAAIASLHTHGSSNS